MASFSLTNVLIGLSISGVATLGASGLAYGEQSTKGSENQSQSQKTGTYPGAAESGQTYREWDEQQRAKKWDDMKKKKKENESKAGKTLKPQ